MVFAWIANAGVVWFIVSACIFMVRQRRRKRFLRASKHLVVSPLAGLAMGAMFLGLQEIVQPQARHMIVEELKEERADDDAGEPLGGRMFHEQMRRIRMGDDVGKVTVKLSGVRPRDPVAAPPYVTG